MPSSNVLGILEAVLHDKYNKKWLAKIKAEILDSVFERSQVFSPTGSSLMQD